MAAAESAALQQLLALGGKPPPRAPGSSPAPPSSSYRSREPTAYRGVTRTSGTNSGLQKFDVQFVFCDNGTKKHPKIYGFSSLEAAARAFDILTCKRALEKGRTVAGIISAGQTLGTNHPAADYADRELLGFLESASRDDCIYGLKQCAKKGHTLAPGMLLAELKAGIEAAQAEAAEKRRIGDPRQSYEVTSKGAERKRRGANASSTPTGAANSNAAAAATAAAASGFQPQAQAQARVQAQAQAQAQAMLAAAAAAAAAAMNPQQLHLLNGTGQAANGGDHAAAATLTASDIVGHFVRSSAAAAPMPAALAAAAAAATAARAPGRAATPAGGPAPRPAEPSPMDADASAQPSQASEERSLTPTEGGPAAGGAARSAEVEPSKPADEGPADGQAGAAAVAAQGAAAAAGSGDGEQGDGAAAPEASAGDQGADALHPPRPSTSPPAEGTAAAAGAATGLAAAAATTQQQQQQQLLLAQLLQSQMAAAATATATSQNGMASRLAAQGLPLLLEMLRVSAASSQEISCAHDIVRIWAAVQQGQNWAAEQCHLPKQYYQGLLPVLQACPDTASILALTSQLWQSGMLRMLCNAYTASLQQQASALAMLQGAAGGGAAAAAGLSQLTSLLTAATGGLSSSLATAAPLGVGDPTSAALAALLQSNPALAGTLQSSPALAALLGQAGQAGGAPPTLPAAPPPLPVPQAQPQPSGRPQRSTAGRGGRLSRQPSSEPPPPAKRSRRGGSSGGGAAGGEAEPPPPPQLQQLLDILSGENPSPRDPAAQLLALQQQPPAAAKAAPHDEEMPDVQPASVAVKTEPGERGAAAAAPAHVAPPVVSAFAALAQQVLPAAPAPPGVALAGQHRSLSLHRSLSSQLPLPANQPNVRIVAAAAPSREDSGDLGTASGAAGAAKAPRATAGGRSIELTITAPPPLQHGTPFGAAARARATITTGAGRPATAAAPAPVTTGTAAGGGSGGSGGEDGGGTPCNGGMVSAFAAAAASLPAIPAPPARPAGATGAQPRPMPARTTSTPATITTGITGTAPQNRSAASIAPAASGGLDVLSRAASLQQPSGGAQEPPRGSSSVADAPVPVPAANGAAASGEEPASKEQGGPAEDMAAGLQPTRQSKEAAAAAPAPEPSATAEAEDGAEVQ